LQGDQHVGGYDRGKEQMSMRHRGCGPERNQEPDHDGMPHKPIQPAPWPVAPVSVTTVHALRATAPKLSSLTRRASSQPRRLLTALLLHDTV
jgi:hypothetical protein